MLSIRVGDYEDVSQHLLTLATFPDLIHSSLTLVICLKFIPTTIQQPKNSLSLRSLQLILMNYSLPFHASQFQSTPSFTYISTNRVTKPTRSPSPPALSRDFFFVNLHPSTVTSSPDPPNYVRIISSSAPSIRYHHRTLTSSRIAACIYTNYLTLQIVKTYIILQATKCIANPPGIVARQLSY